MNYPIKQITLATTLALLLSGCGGGSNGNSVEDNIQEANNTQQSICITPAISGNYKLTEITTLTCIENGTTNTSVTESNKTITMHQNSSKIGYILDNFDRNGTVDCNNSIYISGLAFKPNSEPNTEYTIHQNDFNATLKYYENNQTIEGSGKLALSVDKSDFSGMNTLSCSGEFSILFIP